MVDLTLFPVQPKPNTLNVMIEVPKGSRNKYKFQKGAVVLDRVLRSSVQYPFDYGFVLHTLTADSDPLDSIVMMDEPTFPGCIVAVRPIGTLIVVDEGDDDDKLLCVPAEDWNFKDVRTFEDITHTRLDAISEFFRTYKNLENKKVEVKGWKGIDYTTKLVQESIEAYKFIQD